MGFWIGFPPLTDGGKKSDLIVTVFYRFCWCVFPGRITKILHKTTPALSANLGLLWKCHAELCVGVGLLLLGLYGGGQMGEKWVGVSRGGGGSGEHRLLVHAPHSSGVVSIACSVITSLWKHAQSRTLLQGSNQEKLLEELSETDGSTYIFTLRHNISWNGYFSKAWVCHGKICWKITGMVYFVYAVQLQMQSVAVWVSGAWFIQQSIFSQGYGQVG